MLGLDARALLGARSDEACALWPARHRGEARPAHASAPQRGRAPILHHGGAVARAIEIARLEIALHVEAEAVQDVASEHDQSGAARAPHHGLALEIGDAPHGLIAP